MAKKQDNNISSMIDEVLSEANMSASKERTLVDVITFCEDKRFLDLLGQDPPMSLWPMQKIVLKMFYRGTRGNEHLELTQGEIDILEAIAKNETLDYEEAQGGFRQVIDKYKRGHPHNQMLLVMGRRSSKTLMVSIIAAYEAYKCLETPEGNPHKYYKLSPDKPIAILNVAVSEAQAMDPLFKEIRSRIARSPYFSDKINHTASTLSEVYLLTDNDKRENATRKAKGMSILIDGSIVLKSGHSNSASLRGQAAICILFDEFAHFQNSSGKSSGDQVYGALVPSTRQFGMDGKVVLLSDPLGKDGMFWKLFQMSQEQDQNADGTTIYKHEEILALQLPTWCMNPNVEFAREELEKNEKPKNPLQFMGSWAARFMGEAGALLFNQTKVEECINIGWREPKRGDPKTTYYIHLDPASTSHNYALALVHCVTMKNQYGEIRRKVVVDMVKYWRPEGGIPISIHMVEKTIMDLCLRFRVGKVTFDAFQSAGTIERLRLCGIRAEETQFTPSYTTEVYGELRTLVNEGDIMLCPDQLLIGEMKNMLYKYVSRGIKRFFDPKSMYPSDDVTDAVAGASYQALTTKVKKSLPMPGVVRMGYR